MLFNLIMAVLISTQFIPLSSDKILVCYHDENRNGVTQIWTFAGDTITKGTRFVCSPERNEKPISVRATGKNTFEMKYGKQTINGEIHGKTITYLD